MNRRTQSRRSVRGGFTLMEVLLVLVILVVLAGFAIRNLGGALQGAKQQQARIMIGILSTSLKALFSLIFCISVVRHTSNYSYRMLKSSFVRGFFLLPMFGLLWVQEFVRRAILPGLPGSISPLA